MGDIGFSSIAHSHDIVPFVPITSTPSKYLADTINVSDAVGLVVIPVTPPVDVGSGGGGGISYWSPHYHIRGYRGSKEPPLEVIYAKPKPEPKHIIIEEEPQKLSDTLGKRIEELVITKPEPIPIYIDFIPVRKTINTVKLVEEPKPIYIPKPDIIKGPDREKLRKQAIKIKLSKLKTLVDLVFIEQYV